jgi:hypothetical protein
MNSHNMNSCHRNIYLSYKFFIYFLTIHFHNCLSNVWRAFESHQESQVLVFTKWCDDGMGVLTCVVRLKRIVLHTIAKFSENLIPRTLAQNILHCRQWILLTFHGSVQLTWVADPAYFVVLFWDDAWGWHLFTLLLWCYDTKSNKLGKLLLKVFK